MVYQTVQLTSVGLRNANRPTYRSIRTEERRISDAGQAVWQNRYWEHVLRDETDYRRHVEYIHYNPVKHGYVKTPLDWPHSSFFRYVEAGTYSRDWGGDVREFEGIGRE